MLTPAEVLAGGMFWYWTGGVLLLGLGAGLVLMWLSARHRGKPRESGACCRGCAHGVTSPGARFHVEGELRRDRPLALTEPQPGRFWTRNTEPIRARSREGA